jgi:cytochrome c nitrite reductase small subunit
MRGSQKITAVLIGLAVGLAAYTFLYAKGGSYLTNDPAACANCHVMQNHYDAWLKSSHHSVATCNDCHTPPGLVPKYLVKLENGAHHSWAFTTGRFPDNIMITNRDMKVAEKACRKCHSEITAAIDHAHGLGANTNCIRCHESVGHLK